METEEVFHCPGCLRGGLQRPPRHLSSHSLKQIGGSRLGGREWEDSGRSDFRGNENIPWRLTIVTVCAVHCWFYCTQLCEEDGAGGDSLVLKE